MEVKQIKRLNYLPKVFLVPDLNKFSVSSNFIDCAKYESRSGLTSEGCLKIQYNNDKLNVDSIREVKGIYYIKHRSILSMSYRQKAFRNFDSLKQILSSINFSEARPLNTELLVYYNNYDIAIFDIHYKGHMYEFPLFATQGHLSIYKVPEPKYIYNIEYQDDQEKKELKRELFAEANELTIYNHKITLSKPIMEFKDLYVRPGAGALVYTSEDTHVKIESPDHEPKEININRDTWILFSHPRPHKGRQD